MQAEFAEVNLFFVKVLNDADNHIDLIEGQLVEHGESDEAVGEAVAVREVGDVVVVSLVVVAEMEAQVMEYRQIALVLQGVQQAGTLVEVTAHSCICNRNSGHDSL